MEETGTAATSLKLLGGRVCLDFANTVGWHAGDNPSEHLRSYADIVLWSRHAGILEDDQAYRLMHEAAERPDEADATFDRAIKLREAIYRIFSAIAADRRPETADLDLLNDVLSEALPRLRVKLRAEGFTWSWADADGALDRVLWPVARSAAELLVSGELGRVRECAGQGCGWLFVDVSRNRLRRWCDMKSCGNRAKARRHYERVKAMR